MIGPERPFGIERIIHRGGEEEAHDMRQREPGAPAHEPLEQQGVDNHAQQTDHGETAGGAESHRAPGQRHQALQVSPWSMEGQPGCVPRAAVKADGHFHDLEFSLPGHEQFKQDFVAAAARMSGKDARQFLAEGEETRGRVVHVAQGAGKPAAQAREPRAVPRTPSVPPPAA